MKSTFTIAVFALLVLLAAASANAASPDLINYQGVLRNSGGTPLEGTFSVTFAIWPTPTGNTAIWTETQSVTTDATGLFNVLLGSNTALDELIFASDETYLGIAVESDPEMPRQRLTSVPYAHRAGTVDGASGGVITGQIEATGFDNKIRFLYQNYSDLPSPSSYHGMFAHVHGLGAAYYAHSSQWVRLADSGHTHDAAGIADEAGIVSRRTPWSGGIGMSSATMGDFVVCTVTTPADGSIYITGKATVTFQADNSLDGVALQIDQTLGGAEDLNYSSRLLTQSSATGTFTLEQTVFVDRVYAKSAGQHVFRLEGKQVGNPGSVPTYSTAFITAMYFPTAYGTVALAATQGADEGPQEHSVESEQERGEAATFSTARLQSELAAVRSQTEATTRRLAELEALMPQNRLNTAVAKPEN